MSLASTRRNSATNSSTATEGAPALTASHINPTAIFMGVAAMFLPGDHVERFVFSRYGYGSGLVSLLGVARAVLLDRRLDRIRLFDRRMRSPEMH